MYMLSFFSDVEDVLDTFLKYLVGYFKVDEKVHRRWNINRDTLNLTSEHKRNHGIRYAFIEQGHTVYRCIVFGFRWKHTQYNSVAVNA